MNTHMSLDEQFMTHVQATIENNIDNENFSVEELAHEVGLSRSMLHRKLVKISGKSASETITLFRLQKAKELLDHNSSNVSETAYKVGFRSPSYFNKVFKKYYHVAPGEVLKEAHEQTEYQFKTTSKNKRDHPLAKSRIILIVLVAISFFTIAYFVFLAAPSDSKSVAVLPLENLTGNEENDYFISGIHDALIGELGKISSLRVISRKSTLHYNKSDMLMPDIAHELGVTNIVEGSVLAVGDSIQLIIQLIDTHPKEHHIFANTYWDKLDNVLSIQSTVAKDIAKSINIRLSKKEIAQLKKKRAVNPETYKAYLRGMYHLQMGTEDDFLTGMKYLEDAIKSDPGDPFAYSGVALGYATMGHGQLDSKEAFNRALVAANKAIKLDPTNDQAFTALALLYLYNDWNWKMTESTFTNALSANPNNAIANAHFAWYHILFNNIDESIYYAHRAVMVEPLSASYCTWLGLLYIEAEELEEAEFWARKALDLKKDIPYGYYVLGQSCLKKKQYRQAIEYYERMPGGVYWDALRSYCYVKCGEKEKAVEIWTKMEELAKNRFVNPCYRSMIASNLGYKDIAFELLDEAYQNKLYPITYINYYSGFENLRDDPRYQLMLQKLQLPERNIKPHPSSH